MVLIMVMVSGVYTYLSTHQVVCINYGQLFVCQAYLNKMVKISKQKKKKCILNATRMTVRESTGDQETGCCSRLHPRSPRPSDLPRFQLPLLENGKGQTTVSQRHFAVLASVTALISSTYLTPPVCTLLQTKLLAHTIDTR